MTDIEIKGLLEEHEAFTESLKILIKKILDANKVKYHLIEWRTKDFDSLKEKIERKKILDVKSEITDLTGIRIILYYQSDIDIVEDLIRDNFKIDEDNSINKAETLAKNEFGYLSVHYIINIKDERSKLIEWKDFKNLNAEIQVRTILQHSWAAINHELVYKRKEEMPQELERKLFRLAGLFELADEQFEELKSRDNAIEEDYKVIRQENPFENEPLNLLTLKTDFENANSRLKEIVEVGYSSGFDKTNGYYKEELSKIIIACEILGITSFETLYKILNHRIDKLVPTLKSMLASIRGNKWSGSYSFLTLITLLLNMNDLQLKYFKTNVLYADDLWQITKDAVANNR